jgi:RNA polymerase sigma-70 factor (ECF subfamily)
MVTVARALYVQRESVTPLAAAFEEHRSHLRVVAYRMLGSAAEADDAVQEAWLRLTRADTSAVENLRGWLTTVVARLCLDTLRARTARREEPLAAAPEQTHPTDDRELADSVGRAVLVVLDTLEPAERIAFVLHDVVAMPFEEIAPIVGRSTAAARQLASRARRRVQHASVPEIDLPTQRRVVEAFITALHAGDLDALVAVLGGNYEWARGAIEFQRKHGEAMRMAEHVRTVLVDGRVGIGFAPGGKFVRVLIFTFDGETIREADVVTDPDAIAELVLQPLP